MNDKKTSPEESFRNLFKDGIKSIAKVMEALDDVFDAVLDGTVPEDRTPEEPVTEQVTTDTYIPVKGDRVKTRLALQEDGDSVYGKVVRVNEAAKCAYIQVDFGPGPRSLDYLDDRVIKVNFGQFVLVEREADPVDEVLDETISWNAPSKPMEVREPPAPTPEVVGEEHEAGLQEDRTTVMSPDGTVYSPPVARDRQSTYWRTRAESAAGDARQLQEKHSRFTHEVAVAAGIDSNEVASDSMIVARIKGQRSQLNALLTRLGANDENQILMAIEALESLQNSARASAEESVRLQRDLNEARIMLRRGAS